MRLGRPVIQLLRFGLGLTSKSSSHHSMSISCFIADNDSVYYGFAHDDGPSHFVSALMDRYRPLIEQIYSSGIRKFLFLNCPPSTRSPQVHEENDLPEQFQRHAKMVTAYNNGLNNMFSQFSDKHKDVSISIFLTLLDLTPCRQPSCFTTPSSI